MEGKRSAAELEQTGVKGITIDTEETNAYRLKKVYIHYKHIVQPVTAQFIQHLEEFRLSRLASETVRSAVPARDCLVA